MSNVINLKGSRSAPRASSSSMETLIVSQEQIATWLVPPFQRPLRVNEKVRQMAESLKENGGIVQGVLTLGRMRDDKTALYIVDGQHRLEAFKISGLPECMLDVRIVAFDSLAEMADEFVRLNSSLVKMRPDDVLRGLEASSPALQAIREACPFVGFDQIRRDAKSPMIGMAQALRAWSGGQMETPTGTMGGRSAAMAAMEMTVDNAKRLATFLTMARAAWGTEQGSWRLYGTLNLTLCAWLYNQLVLRRERGVKRFAVLTADVFKRCLMSVSAERDYIDWLLGRQMNERDRAAAYGRLKDIFIRRMRVELPGQRALLPQVPWASK